MKKVILILAMGLLLSGCATLGYKESQNSYGGTVTNHFSWGVSQGELQRRATIQCQTYNPNSTAVMSRRHKGGLLAGGEGGEYDIWSYKCEIPKKVVLKKTYKVGKWTPYEESLWDKITSWFESDSGESAKDKKIKKLENEIKTLKSRGDTQKADQAQKIRDCLMADLEKLMCIGVD